MCVRGLKRDKCAKNAHSSFLALFSPSRICAVASGEERKARTGVNGRARRRAVTTSHRTAFPSPSSPSSETHLYSGGDSPPSAPPFFANLGARSSSSSSRPLFLGHLPPLASAALNPDGLANFRPWHLTPERREGRVFKEARRRREGSSLQGEVFVPTENFLSEDGPPKFQE